MNENEYSSLRRSSSSRVFGIVLALLIILEFCSAILLFDRLGVFSKPKERNYISLTTPSSGTNVRVGHYDEEGGIVVDSVLENVKTEEKTDFLGTLASLFGGMDVMGTGNKAVYDEDEEYSDFCSEYSGHGFDVTDENGVVWLTDTEVEIFSLTSVNGEGVVTVAGDGSAKLIAPGTENSYSFTLRNTGNFDLKYDLEIEAYVTGLDTPLPVKASFYDYKGKYFVGSAEEKDAVLSLDGVTESAYLDAGRIADYTLEWEWPFESGDDVYDTLLGDIAALDHDITLTIVIRTTAECAEIHDDPGGEDPPKTGDNASTFILMLLMILVLMAIVYFLLGRRRSEY